MIENHRITIIRTNPDAADFNMNRLTNQTYKHICKSNKEKEKLEKEVEIKKLKKKKKRTRKQNKGRRKQSKRTKKQFCKRVIKPHVWHFYTSETHQIFC